MKALVNKVINFSNVDGPSTRMAIFLQGCNFNCWFCHNPETINRCINCGACVKTCPTGALKIVNGKVTWNDKLCVTCDTCLKTCKNNSSPRTKEMSVNDLLKLIKKAKPYIAGITVSGGECTLQAPFLRELFKEVKKLGLTTFLDSNGSYNYKDDKELMAVTDKVMLDVKAYDHSFHNDLCTYDNTIVLENLHYLLKEDKLYEVRTIIFPGFDKENSETVKNVSKVIKDACRYKIIRYRPFGVRDKYLKLISSNETSMEEAEKYVRLAKRNGAKSAFVV